MHADFWCGIPLGKMGRRFKDNIKRHLKEIPCEVEEWMELVQNCIQ